MPVDSHLKWNEVRDFTGGLWQTGDQLMPPNAAVTMLDCYPLRQGGLRAFYKAQTFTTTGVASVTLETPMLLFAHEGLINRSGVGTGTDYYLLTWKAGTTVSKLYRMDGTNAETTWTLIKTFAAGLQPNMPLSATGFVDSTGIRYFVLGLGAADGADAGVWAVRYSNGAITQLLSSQQAIVTNYQSRLVVVGSVSNGNPSVLQYSDAGTLSTNLGTNAAPVDVNEGQANITGVATFSPGDLLVFKAGAPIYLVEGDLNNYTVRQMNGSKLRGFSPTRGPDGVIFLSAGDGVYVTPDGSMITPLSKQIKATQFDGPLVFQNRWLFTGKNGLVLDTDSGAWFQTSAYTTTASTPLLKLPQSNSMMIADPASSFTITTMGLSEGSATNRAESYTWKSGPLRDDSGRQTEIRAVEVYANSDNGATSTIAVTVNGVTQTLACDSGGRGALTFYFLARKEELDIQVVAASNGSGVEAPRIECIRFAGQPGHFLRPVADVG